MEPKSKSKSKSAPSKSKGGKEESTKGTASKKEPKTTQTTGKEEVKGGKEEKFVQTQVKKIEEKGKSTKNQRLLDDLNQEKQERVKRLQYTKKFRRRRKGSKIDHCFPNPHPQQSRTAQRTVRQT
jgi:hypothetical protein